MKALVLASGGVDSTTCLGLAVNKYGKENVIALTVAYGQKHTKEIEAARKTAEIKKELPRRGQQLRITRPVDTAIRKHPMLKNGWRKLFFSRILL